MDLITNIEVDGFKSLHKLSIEIRPLTIFIGLNSSGKSSVLQVLEVLKQSVMVNTNNLVTRGHLANLGSFDDIVTKKKGKKKLEITIGGKRAQFLDPPFSRNTEYGYSFTIDSRGMESYGATIRSGQITLATTHERRMVTTKVEADFSKGKISFRKQMIMGRPFNFEGSKGLEAGFDYGNITNRFLEVIALDLKDFRLVPAMRGVSSTSYPLEASSSEDLVDSSNLYVQMTRFVSTVVY